MNELFDLPATAPDRLSVARKRYEAAQHAPAEYIKLTVERTQITDIYVKVVAGTKVRDIPQAALEAAAQDCDKWDWDIGPVSIDSSKIIPEKEATAYELLDLHEEMVERAEAELAAAERERMTL